MPRVKAIMLVAFAGAMWGVSWLVHAGTNSLGFLFSWAFLALVLVIAKAMDRHWGRYC